MSKTALIARIVEVGEHLGVQYEEEALYLESVHELEITLSNLLDRASLVNKTREARQELIKVAAKHGYTVEQ